MKLSRRRIPSLGYDRSAMKTNTCLWPREPGRCAGEPVGPNALSGGCGYVWQRQILTRQLRLKPALHRGLMTQAGTSWRVAQFRPGSGPVGALARALAEEGVLFRDYQAPGLALDELIDTTLHMSTRGLVDIYEQARLGEDVNLLVVVDQFEELFRYRHLDTPDPGRSTGHEAVAFVSLLLAAKREAVAASTTCRVYIVLTMRSDFLGNCAQLPGLAEAINANLKLTVDPTTSSG